MTTIATLLDDVLVATPSCTVPLAKWALFRTAVDFFTRGRMWRQSLAPISLKFARVTGISNTSPAVVTAPAHGFTTGDQIVFADVQGMREINGFLYPVTVIDADTFSLDGVDTTAWPAYSAGVVARASCPVYNIVSPVADTVIVEVMSGDANVTLPEDIIPGFSVAPRTGPAIVPRQPTELDAEFPGWPKYLGLPRWFFLPTETTIRFVPAPHEARNNAISLRIALAPSSDACEIPPVEFQRHRDVLVHGALERLYALPQKPWSSAELTAFHRELYEGGLRRAGIRSHKGNTKAATVARAVSYGGL